jgi:hypothetical protein
MPRPLGRGVSLLIIVIVLCLPLLQGCAQKLIREVDSPAVLDQYKSLAIQTFAADRELISDKAQNRIKDLIKTEIAACCPNRFENISIDSVRPQYFVLNIILTKYDEGSRAARFLVGAGRMKIHAEIEVKDAQSGKLFARGPVKSEFGGGGILLGIPLFEAATLTYGIEKLEKRFAKEVSRSFGELVGFDCPSSWE